MAISRDLIEQFASLVDESGALCTYDLIAPYLSERRGKFQGASPLVLRPTRTNQVSEILRLAQQTGTPIVPQGGNTGLVGGQVADSSGNSIVLSLSRMNRIRSIDPMGGVMTVEAGLTLEQAQNAACEQNLLFPLSLASQGTCQIGGNLSTNAGGVAVLAHGNARDLCLGLEVVLPNGDILSELKGLRKDNTGYALPQLFIGAEGTLGVITAAALKVKPLPDNQCVAWIGLSAPDNALALFDRARAAAGPMLTAFELIADRPLQFALRHVPKLRAPLQSTQKWHVLMEISSPSQLVSSQALAEEMLAPAVDQMLINDTAIATSPAQNAQLWHIRESMSDAQRPEGASMKHDISLPIASIAEFIAKAESLVNSLVPGARVVCFGHMGDGNLHYNVSQSPDENGAVFLGKSEQVAAAIDDLVLSLGGSISAEHGIGQLKWQRLAETASPIKLDLMRRLKTAIDPGNIMNPGKLL